MGERIETYKKKSQEILKESFSKKLSYYELKLTFSVFNFSRKSCEF